MGLNSLGEMRALFALVFDGALVVDQSLLGLAHEALQLLFELGVPARPSVDSLRGFLESLDRQVNLAVILDPNHFGLHPIVQPQVLLHRTNVVSVNLGDMDQSDLALFELDERSVGGDSLHGPVNDRADL
jgi:hypothetical protein